MSDAFTLENITKSFCEWIELGICPDCGGDLDVNDECLGWYGEEPDIDYRLGVLVGRYNSRHL